MRTGLNFAPSVRKGGAGGGVAQGRALDPDVMPLQVLIPVVATVYEFLRLWRSEGQHNFALNLVLISSTSSFFTFFSNPLMLSVSGALWRAIQRFDSGGSRLGNERIILEVLERLKRWEARIPATSQAPSRTRRIKNSQAPGTTETR